MRFLYSLFLMFIFFQCNLSIKIEKERNVTKKGIYIIYGDNDESMREIFVEGDFNKKDFIEKLGSVDTLIGEFIPLSKNDFYNFKSKGIIIENTVDNILHTYGYRDISFVKAKIKVKKTYLGEGFYDPTNPFLLLKMRLDEDNELLIKYKQSYDELLSAKILKW